MSMWKKNKPEPPRAEPAPKRTETAAPARPAPSRPASDLRAATIGPQVSIRGDISGDGDLFIEGRVEGSIHLRRHDVTVGLGGRVAADIYGKKIVVDGAVKGDLYGEEVVIRKTGKVEGNATAKRVTLENGSNFRGSIDMQPGKGGGGVRAVSASGS